jgi:hypothetical protein
MDSKLRPFEFRRLSDGLVYRFEPVSSDPPRWKRTDLDVRCLKDPASGWSVEDAEGSRTGWPQTGDRMAELPPEGLWGSQKGEKGYDYELRWLD